MTVPRTQIDAIVTKIQGTRDLSAGGVSALKEVLYLLNGVDVGAIGCTFDGQGSPLVVGSKAFVTVPYACTITEVIALSDTAGDVVVDVWRDSYANFPPINADSITGSSPVTIVGTDKSTDAVLTGWSTALSEGDVLWFNIDSCSVITQLYIQLKVTK